MNIELAEVPFVTLEGEGINSGVPTLFIRTWGCNLKCSYCDTTYSFEGEPDMVVPVKELAEACFTSIEQYPGIQRISITGGEPLIQGNALIELLILLKQRDIIINLETNGTISNRRVFGLVDEISCDIKGPSSGMSVAKSTEHTVSVLEQQFIDKTWFKFVVSNDKDLNFLKMYKSLPKKVIMKDSFSKDITFNAMMDTMLNIPHCRLTLRMQEYLKIQ